ncbi:MAG: nicotinate-nucleotide adenylyltransferase [Nitrospinaceae bacterium]
MADGKTGGGSANPSSARNEKPEKVRIGVLGGSFDPIHNGHLHLAREACARMPLDQVWFMPANQSPHKGNPAEANEKDRLAMVQLAISGAGNLQACDLEIQRGGRSYTVDTLEELSAAHPEVEWFWLLGLDAFLDFPAWKNPRRLLELAHILVAVRPGYDWPQAQKTLQTLHQQTALDYRPAPGEKGIRELAAAAGGGRIYFLDIPPRDIASRSIRRAIREGADVKKVLPPEVVQYMMSHRLYA